MYGVVKDTVGYYRTAGILNVQDLNDGTHLQHVPAQIATLPSLYLQFHRCDDQLHSTPRSAMQIWARCEGNKFSSWKDGWPEWLHSLNSLLWICNRVFSPQYKQVERPTVQLLPVGYYHPSRATLATATTRHYWWTIMENDLTLNPGKKEERQMLKGTKVLDEDAGQV